MAVNERNLFNKVLVTCSHTRNTLTATSLCVVRVGGETLDIARICKRNYAIVLFNEVFKVDLLCRDLNIRSSWCFNNNLYFS